MSSEIELDPLRWYDANARKLAEKYEQLEFENLHRHILPLLPPISAGETALDVGSGSGRDAEGLARLGYRVVAAEPSKAFREEAAARHSGAQIEWLDDQLPGLDSILGRGLTFDVVWLNAVWMLIAPQHRPLSIERLLRATKQGGKLVIITKTGPEQHDPPMHETRTEELTELLERSGATIAHSSETADAMGRSAIRWANLVARRSSAR